MRIAILGNSAAGKSRFSAWLADRLDLPLLHVDRLLWLPGWRPRAEAELTGMLRNFESQPQWIVDGVGTPRQVRERLARTDLRILIDPPVDDCRRNAHSRAEHQSAEDDRFIGSGLRYADVWLHQLHVIEVFERDWMPVLRARAGGEPGWIRYADREAAYADPRWTQSPA